MIDVADVAAWLRQEARMALTPGVRRVLYRLAKQVESGSAFKKKEKT